jgi:leucyl aminopeptidase
MIGVWFFKVKETAMVKLLPAARDIRASQQRGKLEERALKHYDAVVIAVEREAAAAALQELPFAQLWQRCFEEASSRGPVGIMSARIAPTGTMMILALASKKLTAFERLSIGARVWKELSSCGAARLALATHGMDEAAGSATLEALLSAVLAGSASLPTLKSTRVPAHSLSEITLLHGGAVDLARCLAVDRGNHLARWLTALPPNLLDSRGYRRAIAELAKRHRWSMSFFNETALKRLGAGAFLAVARANEHRDAGIVHLRYRALAGRTAQRRVALVGKGICFDTGGVNLKTHKGMYSMHEDMQGSAVALGVLQALTELKAPYDVDCWLALSENEIGPRAYRPQEVVRAMNGVTIQVTHSDAEGRMVLADTLALAAREQPDLILDFATLTGSCVTALTERYSGAFTNRPQWHGAIELAGRNSGERVWPFPMDEDFDADLESPLADILQCTPDNKGDHILAARFLNRFVPPAIGWIHLDLAASNRAGGLGHIASDFTGFGVRYATHLLLDQELSGFNSQLAPLIAGVAPIPAPRSPHRSYKAARHQRARGS